MTGEPEPQNISTKLQRIAELAGYEPKLALTSLSHHIDIEWLKEANDQTRKDGASGIDGQTGIDYARDLRANLARLHEHFKSGNYRAPAVRRVLIPKGDGKTRPLGIPTYEDKVLQRAVLMALEPVYERDFLDCSYGFRPNRSAHQAIEALWTNTMKMGGGYIIELDIESFFDMVDHSHLRNFLDQRVRDGVIRRMIGKWLNAGVLSEGQLLKTERGTPQGGVISPLLANIYLHEVLDVWFERDVKPRLRSEAFMIRYADDAVLVFANEEDARRVFDVLSKRFEKFGLRLHPEKTKLINFRRPKGQTQSKPDTFDFLGFTHYWGKSKKGYAVIKRQTSGKSFRKALRAVTDWCRLNRHEPIDEQHAKLRRKLRGHYAYFGVTGNSRALHTFLHMVERVWRKWLGRRSQRAHRDWDHFRAILKCYPLPPVRIVRSIYNSQ